ncbi:FIGNL1-interacting regulator of recombination and mitosis isoform X2 [Halyomorpha halys]|uniref:FIGNL1-interacting regulator of recombination and mitosis isoform X2 n=1 Tax=Halyomorpha halys TaxID=286706 RepID=UPI0034D33CA4
MAINIIIYFVFQNFMERDDNIQHLPQFNENFITILKHYPSNSLEDSILHPILSFFHKIFGSNIASIVNLLKINCKEEKNDVLTKLNQLLQVSIHVIDGYSGLIDYLSNLGILKLSYVKSVLTTLPSVLFLAFNHCNESEKLYGIYFLSNTVNLTSLFRKSYEISNIFYKWIDDCIHFDFERDDDTNVLIKALETLYSVGEIVVRLDIKTMVEQWKSLVKLTSKYACFLKFRLDISVPIKFLCSSLQNTIATLMVEEKEKNAKLKLRDVKLANFQLKVIVKLCEMYKGYLNGSEDSLLHLLLLLNRCSRLGSKVGDTEIERFVVVGAAPLLSHLLEDRSFLERFTIVADNIHSLSPEEAVGFLFTHLRLLKFLISCNDEEIKGSWLKIPLLSNIITLFSMSYSILNLNTKIEGTDSYTTLISISVAFMISCLSCEQFVETESTLIEHLFTSHLQTGILISDIMCLLGRLTNEEVCLEETKFLCHILCNLDCAGMQRPEACIVGLTAGRLFHLLSKNGQDIIEKQFQLHLHPHLSFYLNHDFIMSYDMINNVLLTKDNKKCSSHQFLQMIESVTLYNNINDEETYKKLSDAFIEMWIGFESYQRNSVRQPDWWYYIFFLFTKGIPKYYGEKGNSMIKKILIDLLDLSMLKQSSINYYICVIVKNLAQSIISLNDSTVSDIFINCISSSNFLIKQIAIESFVYFANIHHDLLRNASNDVNTEYYISDYYKKIPLCGAINILNLSNAFIHKCYFQDLDIPPNKRIKYDSEGEEIGLLFSKLVDCIKEIKEFSINRNISSKGMEMINSAISDLTKLKIEK